MNRLLLNCILFVGLFVGCVANDQNQAPVVEAYKELFYTENVFSERFLHQYKDPRSEGDTYMGVLAAKKWAVVAALCDQLGSRTPDERQVRIRIKALMEKYGVTGSFSDSTLRPPVFTSPYDLPMAQIAKLKASQYSVYFKYLESQKAASNQRRE